VIAAHIDPATGKIDYRSVWQPKGSAFWENRLDEFIAARPDYGKAAEPVREPRAEPMFHRNDGGGEAELEEQHASDRVGNPSAMAEPQAADEIAVEQVAEAEVDGPEEPQSKPEPAITEANDNTHTQPLDPEALVTVGHPDLEASIADGDKQQRDKAEARTDDPTVQVEGEAATSGGPLICKLPRGCRYRGCQEQGRCLAH
jgi:hypothetical protein